MDSVQDLRDQVDSFREKAGLPLLGASRPGVAELMAEIAEAKAFDAGGLKAKAEFLAEKADQLAARVVTLGGTPPAAEEPAATHAAQVQKLTSRIAALDAQVAQLSTGPENATRLEARIEELEKANADLAADRQARIVELEQANAALAEELAATRADVAEVEGLREQVEQLTQKATEANQARDRFEKEALQVREFQARFGSPIPAKLDGATPDNQSRSGKSNLTGLARATAAHKEDYRTKR